MDHGLREKHIQDLCNIFNSLLLFNLINRFLLILEKLNKIPKKNLKFWDKSRRGT